MKTVVANKKGSKGFFIPVTWQVGDFIKVRANTLEEALQYATEHIDQMPLGDSPDYLEGSYEIASLDECHVFLDAATDYPDATLRYQVQQDWAGYNNGHSAYMVVGVDKEKFLDWAVQHHNEVHGVRFENGNDVTVARFDTAENIPSMVPILERSFPNALVYGCGQWDDPCIMTHSNRYTTKLERCFEDCGNLRIDVRVKDMKSGCNQFVGDLICFYSLDEVERATEDAVFKQLMSLINPIEKKVVYAALDECRKYYTRRDLE